MYDQYGVKIKYLVQPVKLDYEIPFTDTIKLVEEGRFRNYEFVTERGCVAWRVQLNYNQAQQLAKNNNLTFLDESKFNYEYDLFSLYIRTQNESN